MIPTLYDNLFEPKQHFLTTRYRDGRYAKRQKVWKGSQIKRAISKQDKCSDLYITKYPSDMYVTTVILDFDSSNKEEAWNDVTLLHKYLQTKGIKSVIVDSTNKGYHIYIQIKPVGFKNMDNPNLLFNLFVEHLIYNRHFKFKTLDESNTKASLRGNIRVIGSIHPVTQQKVKIVKGKFVPLLDEELYDAYIEQMTNYQDVCFYSALKEYREQQEMRKQIKRESMEYSMSTNAEFDPLKLDLRDIVKEVFSPSQIKESGGNMWINCFEHSDNNPSMVVTEDFYYCKSCGAKGNAWNLIKKGYWKPFKNDTGKGFVIGKGEV